MSEDAQLLAYLNVRMAYQSKVIPNSETITFISDVTGLPQVWTLDEAGKPQPYGELDDDVMNYYHSPDGTKTVVEMNNKGNEMQQLFLLEEAGHKVEPLVFETDYFHHFGDWSPNGDKIAFSSNRRHPGYFDVFTLDLESRKLEKVFEYDGNCTVLQWLDDEHLLINIPETNIDSAIYKLNMASGALTRIGQVEPKARYQSLNVTKDQTGGYVLTDAGEETLYISRFSFAEPEKLEKLVHDEKWDIEEMTLSPEEKQIVYALNEGGISKLFVYQIETEQTMAVKGTARGVITSLAWLNEEQFIFTLQTPTSPSDIWKYSLAEEKLERLTEVSRSKEVEHLWLEPELHTFTSFDGLDIPYFYYDRNPGENKPAVVYVHGGPENLTRADYHASIQYLVNQGFAVAAPNIRGSRGYGRTYIKLDDVRNRLDAVKDLAWLNKRLIEAHGIDPERIGIMGISYGGYMVLSSITHYPDIWAAAVDLVGMSNLRTFIENTGPWRRRLRSFEYGTLEEDAAFFDDIAPLTLADRVKAPLLVFHGRNDSRVPLSESEQMVDALKARNHDVNFIIFDDEGHVTSKVENRVTENAEIVKFFKKHLLDE